MSSRLTANLDGEAGSEEMPDKDGDDGGVEEEEAKPAERGETETPQKVAATEIADAIHPIVVHATVGGTKTTTTTTITTAAEEEQRGIQPAAHSRMLKSQFIYKMEKVNIS